MGWLRGNRWASPAAERNGGLAAAAKQVAEHASALVRLELELAALEIKKKVGAVAAGIGLLLAAAVLLVFVIALGLATAVAALATFLSTWLALLVVTAGALLLALLLGALGVRSIKRGAPPVPEQALREAHKTREALKS